MINTSLFKLNDVEFKLCHFDKTQNRFDHILNLLPSAQLIRVVLTVETTKRLKEELVNYQTSLFKFYCSNISAHLLENVFSNKVTKRFIIYTVQFQKYFKSHLYY
jgi:hypothetical protein